MSYGAFPQPPPHPSCEGTAERRTGGVKAADPLLSPFETRTIARADRPATGGFILGLPRPPSVNEFRRTHGGRPLGNKSRVVLEWVRDCDRMIMAMRPRPCRVPGPFEIEIAWNASEFSRFDLDNPVKPLLDYLQRIELIENDRLCRRLVVGWGSASLGCLVRVEPARS